MGQKFEKLAVLLDKCTKNQEYSNINKSNLIRNSELTSLKEILYWTKNLSKYTFAATFKDDLSFLKHYIIVKEGNANITEELVKKDIKEINNVLSSLKKIEFRLNKHIFDTKHIFEMLESYKYNTFPIMYIIENDELYKYNNLLYSRLNSLIFNSYNEDFVAMIQNKIGIETLTENTSLLINIYNDRLLPRKEKCLINSHDIDYKEAKRYCNEYDNIYFTNIEIQNTITEKNVVIIDYSNYKKFIKLRSSTNLLNDAYFNIPILFKKQINRSKYIVSAVAYFAALQDLKAARGKKRCWICGEKIGAFSFNITCKEHEQYESDM